MVRKTVFITGANRGIGKKALHAFLIDGYDIICSVRQKNKEFQEYVSLLPIKKNQTIRILEFDIVDHKKVKQEITLLYKDKVVLDVLINNAGIADGSLFEMTSIKKLKEVFEVNFFSQLYITQLLLRLLKKSKYGSIINIGSISGIRADRGTLSYGSSKAALMHSTKIIANELSNYGIRVNSIAPNITATDMLNKMEPKTKQGLLDQTFLNRVCKPEEISDLILFLASEKSAYINGQIFRLDGGMI